MTQYFEKIFCLRFCNESLGSDQIHSWTDFVCMDNFRSYVEVIRSGVAGDSHFIQISDFGTHLQFQEGRGSEVDDLLLRSHLVVSEDIFDGIGDTINIDSIGIKVNHGVIGVIFSQTLIVKISIVFVKCIEPILHSIRKCSVL